jgi:hypothetical protein
MAYILKTLRLDESAIPVLEALSQYYGSDGAAAEHAFKTEYDNLKKELGDARLQVADERHLEKRGAALSKLKDLLAEVDGIYDEMKKKKLVDEDVTRNVAAGLASGSRMRKVYEAAVDAVGESVVNQQIGRRCKALTGWDSHEQSKATGPAAELIRSYTKLRP